MLTVINSDDYLVVMSIYFILFAKELSYYPQSFKNPENSRIYKDLQRLPERELNFFK